MPIITYPLNNVDYSAEDVEIYNSTRTSGIYSGDDFTPSANGSDNTITISPGIGWIQNGKFRGKCICMESTEVVTMPVSDATYPRIDSVVIQFDANANKTDVVIKQGIASSSPIPPDVVKTESLYELHICHVNRPAGSAAISASDVTDLRLDDTYCGIMADSVTKVDTTAIKSQIYALIAELEETIKEVKEGSAYLMTSGGTMNGSINMNGHEFVGLESPTEESSATSKEYVDTEIGSVRKIAQSSQSTANTALNTANAATAYTNGSATLNSSNTTGGTVKYYKYGRLVQVNINNLGLKVSAINASTWREYTVATKLPKPAIATAYEHLYIEAAQSNAGRFQVKTDGSLIFYHHDTDLVRGGTEDTAAASGVITYISAT